MRSFPSYLIFMFLPLTLSSQTRWFVDRNAAGGVQTGKSWTAAFSDLQMALAAVVPGDTIWVAAGTYMPTLGNDRTVSFELVDGVHLYGGFSGTETALEQRNPEINKTILSGDIGVPQEPTDNAYHVLRGKGLGDDTVVDGFYITNGYSYNDFTPVALDRFGAGLLLEGAPGVADSRPVIQNCFFENNRAYEGGAICATWVDPTNPLLDQYPVNPVLRHCTFSRNQSSRNGGALYKYGPSGTDTFRIEDCRFLDNKAYVGEGGAIYFNATANSHTLIRRCLFERDSSFAAAGGAISYPANPPDKNTSSLLLDSCVFRENMALEGGAFYYDGVTVTGQEVGFNCRMLNCLFDGNLARSGDGSAYFIIIDGKGKVFVEVEDCTLRGNLAEIYTSKISAFQSCESQLLINRCKFYGNLDRDSPNQSCFSVGHVGGRYATITTQVANSLFFNNGGGIGVLSYPEGYSTTQITNCTFFDNNDYIFAKSWDTLYNQPSIYFNEVFIDNCILWEPGTTLRKMFYNNEPFESNMYGYHINHTLMSLKDSVSVAGGPAAFENGVIWGQFPGFQDSLAGDFRLKPCSPAVGKGNNQVVFDHNLQVDLDSLPRIRFGTVDLGAYEQQDSCVIIATASPQDFPLLKIWPNPSPDGVLHFEIPAVFSGRGEILIFDAQGQFVYQREEQISRVNMLNLERIPRGGYTVSVQIGDVWFVGKWLRL